MACRARTLRVRWSSTECGPTLAPPGARPPLGSLSSLPLPLAPGPARPCLAPAPTARRARCPPWQDEAWIKLLRHEDEGRLWRRRQAGCVFVESVNELGLGLGLGLTLTLTLTLTC